MLHNWTQELWVESGESGAIRYDGCSKVATFGVKIRIFNVGSNRELCCNNEGGIVLQQWRRKGADASSVLGLLQCRDRLHRAGGARPARPGVIHSFLLYSHLLSISIHFYLLQFSGESFMDPPLLCLHSDFDFIFVK